MEQHSAIIFPGDLTHLYHIKPKSSDVIVFLSALHDSNYCIEMNGKMQCEGFEEWEDCAVIWKSLITVFKNKKCLSL